MMNRARSLLQFGSPARVLKILTSPMGTLADIDFRPNQEPLLFGDGPERESYEPPAGFVSLYRTDCAKQALAMEYECAKEAFALRYDDGPKAHIVAFGPGEAYRMTNSCDGLVGVYGRDGFWIANPTIPRVAALPRCSPHVCTAGPAGVVFRASMPNAAIGIADASTRDHKVVRLFAREQAGCLPISLGCEVLSLKGDSRRRFWKQVDDVPTYAIATFSMPLVVDGIVYWTLITKWTKTKSKFRRSVIALCFDLREEKFSLLHHPMGWEKRTYSSSLFLLEGRPCLVDLYRKGATVWCLEDRASSKWVRLRDFSAEESGYGSLYLSRKVYYELSSSIDFNDMQTLTRFMNEASKLPFFCEWDTTQLNLKEYHAPYTENNFWPF